MDLPDKTIDQHDTETVSSNNPIEKCNENDTNIISEANENKTDELTPKPNTTNKEITDTTAVHCSNTSKSEISEVVVDKIEEFLKSMEDDDDDEAGLPDDDIKLTWVNDENDEKETKAKPKNSENDVGVRDDAKEIESSVEDVLSRTDLENLLSSDSMEDCENLNLNVEESHKLEKDFKQLKNTDNIKPQSDLADAVDVNTAANLPVDLKADKNNEDLIEDDNILVKSDKTIEDSTLPDNVEEGVLEISQKIYIDTKEAENLIKSTKKIEVESETIDAQFLTQTPRAESSDISLDNSAIAVNKDHGLTKPDCMIEIPTQEFIDFDDESPDCTDNMNMSIEDANSIKVTPAIDMTASNEIIDEGETITDLVNKKLDNPDTDLTIETITKKNSEQSTEDDGISEIAETDKTSEASINVLQVDSSDIPPLHSLSSSENSNIRAQKVIYSQETMNTAKSVAIETPIEHDIPPKKPISSTETKEVGQETIINVPIVNDAKFHTDQTKSLEKMINLTAPIEDKDIKKETPTQTKKLVNVNEISISTILPESIAALKDCVTDPTNMETNTVTEAPVSQDITTKENITESQETVSKEIEKMDESNAKLTENDTDLNTDLVDDSLKVSEESNSLKATAKLVALEYKSKDADDKNDKIQEIVPKEADKIEDLNAKVSEKVGQKIDLVNDLIKVSEETNSQKEPAKVVTSEYESKDADDKHDETKETVPTEADKMEGTNAKMTEIVAQKIDLVDRSLQVSEEPNPQNETTKEVASEYVSKDANDKHDEMHIPTDSIQSTTETEASDQNLKDLTQTNQESVSVDAIKTVPELLKPETSIKSNQEPTTVKESDQIAAESHITLKESDKLDQETSAKDTQETKDPKATLPSTSMVPDGSDEEGVMDSLGLLAESSRVMEDDEEPDDEDDGDDDDDFDADDDSSHHVPTEEHSEDSNHCQTDIDIPKEISDVDTDTTQDGYKLKEAAFDLKAGSDEKEQDGDMEVDLAEDTALTEASEIDIEEHPTGVDITIDTSDTDVMKAEKDDVTSKVSPVKQKAEDTDIDEAPKKEMVPNNMLRHLLLTIGTGLENKVKSVKLDVKSPSKLEKLSVAEPSNVHVQSIVDLDGSSSEDDVKNKVKTNRTSKMENASELAGKESSATEDKSGDIVMTTKPNESNASKADESQAKNEEVFNLDSDTEDSDNKEKAAPVTLLEPETGLGASSCINYRCTGAAVLPAPAAATLYYNAKRRRKPRICLRCHQLVVDRTRSLVDGIKDLTPLLDLDMCKNVEELVEISDSESDDEKDVDVSDKVTLSESAAEYLKNNLADVINDTWCKYDMDNRLKTTQETLESEIKDLESECKEIDSMLNECQVATDKLRKDLYSTFEQEKREIPGLHIFDTGNTFSITTNANDHLRYGKRKSSSSVDTPSKKPAVSATDSQLQDAKQEDDNVDVCVVKLSGESAPAGLPPPGEITRAVLKLNMTVYAMRNAFGSWLRANILDIQPKGTMTAFPNFTVYKLKFEHKSKNKILPARCIAYEHPATVRLTIGTRVIALFKDDAMHKKETYYSGVVAEIPNPVNSYRYLVFFDDGYAQYVQHKDTRLVVECSPLVWEEVHPFSRQFVREYLMAYPERPMVRLHANQTIKTEWNGKWWVSRVIKVDASLVQVHFEEDDRTEWIYRGSTRLAPLYLELKAAERHRARPLPRSTNNQKQLNMPYVEYTRTDEPGNNKTQNEELRRQRAVAKKSTAPAPAPAPAPLPAPAPAPAPHAFRPAPPDASITSRVVYYTPKNAVKPLKMTTHMCGTACIRSDVLGLKELRTYNPLAKPLLSGWERQLVRYKGQKDVMYRAPCGRRLRSMKELHAYLNIVNSEMSVDLFDFNPNTHCLAEFVLNKCLVSKKDLSHGKENVPVPCVNYYDESLPEFCSYNTERTPTAGVPLTLDPEFLCGCDCTDDCQDKKKCACWQMTLEGARTIGMDTNNVGYSYKRLPEPLPSGIYECNSRCKCKNTCLNRVAQHPLQLKLQVFKTMNRGWGIRALNDVPKGSFLCVYAGNLLTDATANLDGLNEGDEYLAELDYIEVVEQMKEGYEEDIPDADKELGKTGKKVDEAVADDDEDQLSPSEDEVDENTDKSDGDFKPDRHVSIREPQVNKKTLRKREKKKEKEKKSKAQDDCITISDDEELREPSRFMAEAGMSSGQFISKYKSVRTLFGKDEACYIMDAKVQGNIGRYLNHSCSPNVFVQNVFVDTHDPRFPWVAFFASSHIKAGTELTWNYNYDIGSVPEKVLYCYCGAQNCRGRLL